MMYCSMCWWCGRQVQVVASTKKCVMDLDFAHISVGAVTQVRA